MGTDFIKKRIKSLMPKFLKDMSDDGLEFYIAGGTLTSLVNESDVNDLDIYIKDGVDLFEFVRRFKENVGILSSTPKSVFATKSGQHLNLILLDTFESPEDIFNSFDFTCVMGCYDYASDELKFHDDFLLHNSQRRLFFNSATPFPIMSAIRVKKYEERGYKISKNEMIRILLSCSRLNISSYEDLAEQINGLYGFEVKNVFDITEPFNLDKVIEKILEIDFDDYSKHIKDTTLMWEDAKTAVFNLYEKNGAKLTKVKTIVFDKDYKKIERDYLCVNDFLCDMPEAFEARELPYQKEGIKVVMPINKEGNLTYKVMKEYLVEKGGDVTAKDNDSFHVPLYDCFNPINQNGDHLGLFEVRHNWASHNDYVSENHVRFGQMTLKEVTKRYRKAEEKVDSIFDDLFCL